MCTDFSRGTAVPEDFLESTCKVLTSQVEGKKLTGPGMVEGKSVGAETDGLPGRAGLAVWVVLGVADDRASDVGELYADLVVATGVQFDLQFGDIRAGLVFAGVVAAALRHDGVVKFCKSCVFGGRGADPGKIGAGILRDVMLQGSLRLWRASFDEGAVVFAEALVGKLTVQFPCGEGGLGKDQDPGYGLVQAVDNCKIRLALGASGLVDVVLEDAYHVRMADPPALGCNSVGFYAYHDVVVFV